MFMVMYKKYVCTIKSPIDFGLFFSYYHGLFIYTQTKKYILLDLVVLQTRIFFLVGDPEKRLVYIINLPFFRLQNHFSPTLKITSKGTD